MPRRPTKALAVRCVELRSRRRVRANGAIATRALAFESSGAHRYALEWSGLLLLQSIAIVQRGGRRI